MFLDVILLYKKYIIIIIDLLFLILGDLGLIVCYWKVYGLRTIYTRDEIFCQVESLTFLCIPVQLAKYGIIVLPRGKYMRNLKINMPSTMI